MPDVEQRLDAVETRLGAVEKTVGELRGEVGELRGEVGELRGEVGELRSEVGGLRGLKDEVQKLRVLGEENERRINLVIEVQAAHGAALERITRALEPLDEMQKTMQSMKAFMQAVAENHERRIFDLEKHTGLRQPPN
jgi:predicted RNase H-like nuclease (RuvC/YqgF family)